MSSFDSGSAQRFGNTPLAFGLTRFEAKNYGESRAKWFFSVQRYIGRDTLIEIEIDPKVLREMQRFIERAIETVATDGRRTEKAGLDE